MSNKDLNKSRDTKVYITLLILYTFAIMPFGLYQGGILMYVSITIEFIFIVGLAYLHSRFYSYICPQCGYKFKIGFMKDLFTLNGGAKGKKLKCPNCHAKGWFKEKV